MSEQRTPFIFEVVMGFLALVAVFLYLRGSAFLFVILIFCWLAIFRQRVMTVAGAVLMALATSPQFTERRVEFLIVLAVIIGGILVELFFAIGLPVLQGQPIKYTSVLETTVFYVIGVAIAYFVQISFCGIAMIDNGSFSLLRIQSLILECQFQGGISPLVCLRWILTSSLLWGCTMVVLRRINFDLQRLSQFPVLFIRAFLGWIVVLIVPISINAVILAFPELIMPIINIYSPPYSIIYSYLYFTSTILLAAFGTSIATRNWS